MMNKKIYFLSVVLLALLSMAKISVAAPGTLSTQPLVSATFANPNVFFLVDSSGSMGYIIPTSPFDSGVSYYTCPTTMAASNASIVYLKVTSQGDPYFNLGGNTDYDWSNQTSTKKGGNNNDVACFDNAKTYKAVLFASSSNGSSTTYSSDMGGMSYSGNYLNWYFASSPTNWGRGATQKPGQLTRLDLAKQAVQAWMNSLTNVYVGLAQFNGATGANVLVGVDNINTNKSALLTALTGIQGSGASPIAGALRDVGRYFVENFNSKLTLHPGQPNESQMPANNIFNNQPVYAGSVTKASPIRYYCQPNILLLLTDGMSSGDTGIDSSTGLQDYDGDCKNATPACLTYDRKVGGVYDPDGGSDYADDVAYALRDINLRPDLGKGGNHMNTSVIGFVESTSVNIPYMKDIAAQGGGLFASANNATELLSVLESTSVSVFSQTSISAPVTFNSHDFSTDSAIYWARYSTGGWTGNVLRATINASGNVGTPTWEFAKILDSTAPSTRFLFTYNRDVGQNNAVLFKTLSSLSTAQQADLNQGPSAADSLGQQRIDYLRGDRSREILDFRARGQVLADIVDSGPVYVGKPDNVWLDKAPFPTTSKYSDFVTSKTNRTPVLYVGDNGGVLHAINANTGAEMFGYLPSNLFSNAQQSGYHYLTQPAYNHRFYVDLTGTVSDAYIASRTAAAAWRTVLIMGEGAGGRGYTALDVTDPGQFTTGNEGSLLLWEFSSVDDVNLGYTFAKPVIGLMNNGRWAAIFGNGYNNTGTGSAQLFIVFLDGGLDGVWTPGVDYIRLDTKSGTLVNADGLGTAAAVDTDSNGTIDRIYAGGLNKGAVWAFDVSNSSASQWKVAYGTTAAPLPLFYTATTGASTDMPVTAPPLVVKHPTVVSTDSNAPNLMVYVGTGQYLTTNDISNTDSQRLFGVWDKGTSSITSANLVQQTFTTSGSTRTVSNNFVDYGATGTASVYGWFINLTGGERTIQAAKLGDNSVIFTTMKPDNTAVCAYGGSGWVLAVSQDKGGATNNAMLDVTGDDLINASDQTSSGAVAAGRYIPYGLPSEPTFHGDYMYVPLSSGVIEKIRVNIRSVVEGRFAWHVLTGKKD